jgi:hypothetical protein
MKERKERTHIRRNESERVKKMMERRKHNKKEINVDLIAIKYFGSKCIPFHLRHLEYSPLA